MDNKRTCGVLLKGVSSYCGGVNFTELVQGHNEWQQNNAELWSIVAGHD